MKNVLFVISMLTLVMGLNAQMTDVEIKAWHASFDQPDLAPQDNEMSTDAPSTDDSYKEVPSNVINENNMSVCNTLQECRTAIKYGDDETKMKAFKVLIDYKSAAVPVLIVGLKDKDSEVRSSAADALGGIGPAAKEAIPHLVSLLDTGYLDVDRSATFALGRIGAAAVPALIKALSVSSFTYVAQDSCSSSARFNVFYALGNMGPAAKGAVPFLIQALKNDDIRSDAVGVLASIGPAASAAIPDLEKIEKYNKKLSKLAALALVNIRNSKNDAPR